MRWSLRDFRKLGPALNLAVYGHNPSLGLNSVGVPRIAYYDVAGGGVRYTACTSSTPPCQTPAQWSDSLVDTGGDFPTLSVGADDRARIAYTNGSSLRIATEILPGSATFTLATIDDCAGPLSGSYPSVWMDSGGGYRVSYTAGATFLYTQLSP